MARRDIIVIGASAGGVEALIEVVRHLPADLGAAVLVVLHIPPDSPSRLRQILERAGQLPVASAEEGQRIEVGHVYVASADRHLVIADQCMRLTRGPRENRSRPAIDVLFRSAAYWYGPRAIGVILSGSLDDGTAGLWEIKDRGGVAVVQSPDEASNPSMPRSAITSVAVDHVLPAAEIADLLVRLSKEEVAEQPPVPTGGLALEVEVALEGNLGLQRVMALGELSPNTCPRCHGVLVKIVQGKIVRFRCHMGHSFSIQSLLAEVDEAIDTTVWATIRAMEERSLLLQDLEQLALGQSDPEAASRFADESRISLGNAQQIRDVVLSSRSS